MLVPFEKFAVVSNLIPQLLHTFPGLSICEFIDRESIKYSELFLGKKFEYSDKAEAQLLVEFDGNDENNVLDEVEKAGEFFLNNGALDVFIAEDSKNKNKIWEMRRNLRDALTHIGKNKIGEDVVVPRKMIPDLLNGCKQIGIKNGINVVCYGHTGDGNVHVNVVQDDLTDNIWNEIKYTAVEDIFRLAIKLKGSISGEHGIGIGKKKYLNWKLSENEINLMRKIKRSFDLKNILNPGKIFDL